jgi:hypothetical protein
MYNYNYNWFTLHPVPHQFVPGRVDCRKFDNGAVLFLSCIIQFYFIFFIFFQFYFCLALFRLQVDPAQHCASGTEFSF